MVDFVLVKWREIVWLVMEQGKLTFSVSVVYNKDISYSKTQQIQRQEYSFI